MIILFQPDVVYTDMLFDVIHQSPPKSIFLYRHHIDMIYELPDKVFWGWLLSILTIERGFIDDEINRCG